MDTIFVMPFSVTTRSWPLRDEAGKRIFAQVESDPGVAPFNSHITLCLLFHHV